MIEKEEDQPSWVLPPLWAMQQIRRAKQVQVRYELTINVDTDEFVYTHGFRGLFSEGKTVTLPIRDAIPQNNTRIAKCLKKLDSSSAPQPLLDASDMVHAYEILPTRTMEFTVIVANYYFRWNGPIFDLKLNDLCAEILAWSHCLIQVRLNKSFCAFF